MRDPEQRGHLRMAMIGTRGVPAAYGGFETAVEEIGHRLVSRGHEVTVYCRTSGDSLPRTYRGMDLVHLPSLHVRALETLSHTALSIGHLSRHRRPDVAFVFNSANSPFLPRLRRYGVPTAVHVDGLEWKRGKWGPVGRRYYRWAEEVAVRQADALISDARGIVDYYQQEFDIHTDLITYGAKILRKVPTNLVSDLDLTPGGYYLVVARFEPENHVDVIVEGYLRSGATLPLVVVGSAPYAAEYTSRVATLAASDPRIRLLGGVWDQDLLDQLYAHAFAYLHGHSVGGTNPSLLRAMGAGTAVLAWDVVFNREVLGSNGAYFQDAVHLANLIEAAERNPHRTADIGPGLQRRAGELFNWDSVTTGYENLAMRLAGGYSTHGMSRGRTGHSAWSEAYRQARQPSPATVRRSIT